MALMQPRLANPRTARYTEDDQPVADVSLDLCWSLKLVCSLNFIEG